MMKDYSYGVIPIKKTSDGYRLLLIQHQGKYGGHWSFPKGHKHPGESDTETALRELHEETGMSDVQLNEDAAFLEKYVFTNQSGERLDKQVKFYLGYVKNDTLVIQEAEIKDFRWVTPEEGRELATFQRAKEIIDEVAAYLTTNGEMGK